MTQTLVELTDEQMNALEELATKRHVSPAEIIREEINQLLQHQIKKVDPEMKQRALSVAGSFSSGVNDFARNHDNYLDEVLSNDSIH